MNKTNNKKTKSTTYPKAGRVGGRGRTPPNTKGGMLNNTTKKYQFCYSKKIVKEPIIYHIIKHYNIIPNILRANITESINYLKSISVKVKTFKTGTQLNKNKCTQCSLCVAHCPTGALHIPDRKTMEVEFDSDKCIECGACISICPYGAIDDLNGNQNTDL